MGVETKYERASIIECPRLFRSNPRSLTLDTEGVLAAIGVDGTGLLAPACGLVPTGLAASNDLVVEAHGD